MSGYLLDTNLVSEIRKGRQRANSGVYRWWQRAKDEPMFLSVMVLGEIRKGISNLTRRDRRQGLILERWFEEMERDFSDRVLDVTRTVAGRWGEMQAIRPLPAVDALIAATAMEHDLVLVTRNDGDFKDLGVQVLNPFS